MRIVGGTFRGRALASPKHEGLRPTSDRVRESLFNILEHGVGDISLKGTRVIDLFAGTGALGLEALSRGADFCLFVEDRAEARAVIRTNVEAMQLTGKSRIFRRDATNLGDAATMSAFGLAFLDPPYDTQLGAKALEALATGGWLTPRALVVLEESAGVTVHIPDKFVEFDRRTYGDTQVILARYDANTEGST